MSQARNHIDHRPGKTARCECESVVHMSHDNADGTTSGPTGHCLGCEFPVEHIKPVVTVFGTFNVCPACAQTCYGPDSGWRA